MGRRRKKLLSIVIRFSRSFHYRFVRVLRRGRGRKNSRAAWKIDGCTVHGNYLIFQREIFNSIRKCTLHLQREFSFGICSSPCLHHHHIAAGCAYDANTCLIYIAVGSGIACTANRGRVKITKLKWANGKSEFSAIFHNFVAFNGSLCMEMKSKWLDGSLRCVPEV